MCIYFCYKMLDLYGGIVHDQELTKREQEVTKREEIKLKMEQEKTEGARIRAQSEKEMDIEKIKIKEEFKFKTLTFEGQKDLWSTAIQSNQTECIESSYSWGPLGYLGFGTKTVVSRSDSEVGRDTLTRMLRNNQ